MYTNNSIREFTNSRTNKTYQSFFDACRTDSIKIADIDKEAIADFLIHGCYYTEKTPIKHVKKRFINKDCLIPNDEFYFKYEDSNSAVDHFINTFEVVAEKIRGRSISADITGGTDSRLIIALLQYYDVPFEGFFSTISGDLKELKLVESIAKYLDTPLHVISSVEKPKAQELVQLSDGLIDIFAIQSLYESLIYREKAGFDLTITGVAGELYKDFWWQQDFPFYGSKKPDLSRLISSRMYPLKFPDNLFADKHINYTRRIEIFKRNLEFYASASNIETYDSIYLNVRIKEQVSLFKFIADKFVPSYSPLLEQHFLSISNQLPPSIRWFNRFHRQMITKLNPRLAMFPTTEGGMTVSSKNSDYLNDFVKYSVVKSAKLFSKLIKTSDLEKSTEYSVSEELTDAMDYLSEIGMFNYIDVNELSHPKLSTRIISLKYHIKELLNDY